MTLALGQQFIPQFNNPMVPDHHYNKKVTKTMLMQVNMTWVCVYNQRIRIIWCIFVIGLAILSFCSNFKSTMEIQSCNIDVCETIGSTSTIPKNNAFTIVNTICDSHEAATVTGRSGNNNNGDDDRGDDAKKNKDQLNRKLIDRKSVLDISEDKDEAYQIYQPLTNNGDHVHHATHTK